MQFTVAEKRCDNIKFFTLKNKKKKCRLCKYTIKNLQYKNQIFEIEKVTVVSLSLSAHQAPSVTTTE